jgi:Retrotransposon gag protein
MLEAKIDKGKTTSPVLDGTSSTPQPVSTFCTDYNPEKDPSSFEEMDFLRRDSKFHFPRSDFPGFNGLNSVEWLCKRQSYFVLHHKPLQYRTHLATMQFFDVASEWYDGYLINHEPPNLGELVRLVTSRFKKLLSKNSLDELKGLNQTGSVEIYWHQFEKLRSRMLLEGCQFSKRDFIDAFISGLSSEIKPLVMAFKPKSLETTMEYATYVKSAVEQQYKKWKGTNRFVPHSMVSPKYPDKTSTTHSKGVPFSGPAKRSLMDQRRALGLCFRCGEKYHPGHQCKVKLQILMGEIDEQVSSEVIEQQSEEPETFPIEEAFVSMHVSSNY